MRMALCCDLPFWRWAPIKLHSRFSNREVVSQIEKPLLGSGDKTVTRPKSPGPDMLRNSLIECGKPHALLPFKLSQATQVRASGASC